MFMKEFSQTTLLTFFLFLCTSFGVSAQRLIITDTVDIPHQSATDSSFRVKGEVAGLDSGTIKLSWAKNAVYVPIRQGKFSFSGFVNSPQNVRLEILSDY